MKIYQEKPVKSLSQTLPKKPFIADNIHKESIKKLSTSPLRSKNQPKQRDPILQQDEPIPKPKSIKISPIINSPERPKGKAQGQFASLLKKSAIFAEPTSEFVPSKKLIRPALFDIPQLLSFKKSSWHPEPHNPIIQDTVPQSPIKIRDKNFHSTVFSSETHSLTPDFKARTGKYFEYMNSNVFNNTLKEKVSKRKKLSKKPEIEEVISYKGNQSFRDNITIKDPQQNLITKKDLVQSKVLKSNAEVFKQREIQSNIFS